MRFQPRTALIYAVIILAILIPRLSGLDQFVTVDEPKWLARSGNFYLALAQGDLAETFTREHPGVTTTWAGTLGLLWRYPELKDITPGYLSDSSQIEPLIREQDLEPLYVLEAGRVVMVLLVAITLVISLWAAIPLIGLWPAILSFLFIAFDPFYLGLSRLLHLDALMSSLMLLSILAFLNYLHNDSKHSKRLLLISGVGAGLAWLTKSPAFFLIPFLGLVVVLDWLRRRYLHKRFRVEEIWNRGWFLALWVALGALTFVVFWPAMWVNPVNSVKGVLGGASSYAEEGHTSDVYFKGAVISGDPQRVYTGAEDELYGPWAKVRVNGDEGYSFYLTAYLWRTTPVVMVGLILAAVGFVLRWKNPEVLQIRWMAVVLVLFAGSFAVFMTFGSKKFDRYLLPIFLPLDILAAIGWWMTARWIRVHLVSTQARFAIPVMLGVMVLLQATSSLQTQPYYLSYYNPLMGGSESAPEVMMIGWGEGLDQAARYLNGKPNPEDLRVLSWYPDGSFSYIFKGETVEVASEWEPTKERVFGSDYVVVYIHQWQRQLPFSEMLAYFERQSPEHVIRLNGIEYAQIYRMQDVAQH